MIYAYNPGVPGSLTTMFREALENNPGYVELKPGEEPVYTDDTDDTDDTVDAGDAEPASRRKNVKATSGDDAAHPVKE